MQKSRGSYSDKNEMQDRRSTTADETDWYIVDDAED